MKKVLFGVALVMVAVALTAVPAHATTVSDLLDMIQDLQAENAAQQVQINQLIANQGDISGLEADVAALQTDVANLDAATANLQALDPFVTVQATTALDATGVAGPNVYLTGINLHLLDGSGQTYAGGAPFAGHGNLIIGYDELPTVLPGPPVPVIGRNGSHCLVLGAGNQWAADASFIGGAKNAIRAPFSFIATGPGRQTTIPFQALP